ncbi:hypothetical protein JW835_07080 [bacterium]|nr:hypothetical protein [bacterium]
MKRKCKSIESRINALENEIENEDEIILFEIKYDRDNPEIEEDEREINYEKECNRYQKFKKEIAGKKGPHLFMIGCRNCNEVCKYKLTMK